MVGYAGLRWTVVSSNEFRGEYYVTLSRSGILANNVPIDEIDFTQESSHA